MPSEWEYFDEERVAEFAVESFDFDDEYETLEPSEYDERRVLDEFDRIIELAELAEEVAQAELGAFGCIWAEEEPPIEEEFDRRTYLWARVDMLSQELDESGIEDALDWERWDEYERALYALAELETFGG